MDKTFVLHGTNCSFWPNKFYGYIPWVTPYWAPEIVFCFMWHSIFCIKYRNFIYLGANYILSIALGYLSWLVRYIANDTLLNGRDVFERDLAGNFRDYDILSCGFM